MAVSAWFLHDKFLQCFLTRSKSYLQGPGLDAALRGERWWHERRGLPGLPWAALGCLGYDALGAGLNMAQVLSSDMTRLRINFYSRLDLEIPPAGPKSLSLGCQLFAILKRGDFCFQSPKVGWLNMNWWQKGCLPGGQLTFEGYQGWF